MTIKGKQIATGADGIATANIVDLAITSAKIAVEAVGSAQLATASVQNYHLADGAVTAAALGTGSILAVNLATGSVTSAAILDGTIQTADIGSEQITNALLATGSVSSANIINGTIQTADIGSEQITNALLATGSVSSANIIDGTIQTADIGSEQITNALLATGSVSSANIINGTIQTADIGSEQITNALLATGSVSSANIIDGTITNDDLSGNISLSKLETPVLALSGGTMAGNISMASTYTISNLAAPVSDNDAARKIDVDRATAGLDVKESVVLATDVNVANTASVSLLSQSAVDGQTITNNLVDGDRVLLKAQSAGAENGIYYVTGVVGTTGSLLRATDADEDSQVTAGMFTFVTEGNNADQGFVLATDDPITLGVTSLSFTQFSGVGSLTFGTPVNVGTANSAGVSTDAARSDHVHDSPQPSKYNKDQSPSATAGGDADSGLTITYTPGLGSYVRVLVNGVAYEVGDGVTGSVDCYFGPSAGTARAFTAIVATDKLFWNGDVSGFNLETSDQVDFEYITFQNN